MTTLQPPNATHRVHSRRSHDALAVQIVEGASPKELLGRLQCRVGSRHIEATQVAHLAPGERFPHPTQ
jgi:hypothetical protein